MNQQLVGNLFLFGFLFLFIYLVMIRPNKRARQEHARLVESIETGDEVITNSGMYGTVGAVGEEDVEIEIAPGTTVRFVKSVVVRRVTEELHVGEDEDEDEREPENA